VEGGGGRQADGELLTLRQLLVQLLPTWPRVFGPASGAAAAAFTQKLWSGALQATPSDSSTSSGVK
jgi:hypothetical protein